MTDRIVLVIGASSKVGRELIKEFASRNYKLILHCCNHCRELIDEMNKYEKLKQNVLGIIRYDFRESRSDLFVDKVSSYARKLDAIVALSAIYDETPDNKLTDDLVMEVFQINLLTYVVALPKLIELLKDSGIAILFSDAIALKDRNIYVGLNPSLPYVVSKSGLITLAKFLSSKVTKKRIVVIAPSWIDTGELNTKLKLRVIESTSVKEIINIRDLINLIILFIEDMRGISGVVIELSSNFLT